MFKKMFIYVILSKEQVITLIQLKKHV